MKMAEQRKGLLLLASCVMFACLIAEDVPDGVVYTDVHKIVQKGNTVVLKCEFYKAPIAVYWKKGDDPDKGTNLITWVEGTKLPGACANDNACDIGDDFSLTIGDVQVADEGRYICRVSNYLGILIHNYTDVKIYAPPTDPFPVIMGCTGINSAAFNSTEHCTVLTSVPVAITCSALNYYPDLDLFFLHGSKRISDTATDERENIDGTKNKSIAIKGSPSKTPYICVASDVPGSQDQFTATVMVILPVVPTSTENGAPFTSQTSEMTTVTEKTATDNKSAKIAIPVVLVVVAAAVVTSAFVWWRGRNGKNGNKGSDHKPDDIEQGIPLLRVRDSLSYELWLLAFDTPEDDMGKVRETLLKLGLKGDRKGITAKEIYETLCQWKEKNDVDHTQLLKEALEGANFECKWQKIHGIVSFYELWLLIYGIKDIDLKKVRIMLRELGLENIPEDLNKKDAYETLCKWKEENKNSEQTKHLQDAFSKAKIEQNWKIMIEHKKECTTISRTLLRQVTVAVEHAGKTKELLKKLVPDRFEDLHTTQKRDVTFDPTCMLLEWSEGSFEEHPKGLLSLALEKAGCSPLDRTFFDGIVSFYELWLLIFRTKEIDLEKVRIMLDKLGLEDVPEDLSKQCAYETLCKWKEKNNFAQTKLLKDALDEAKIEQSWKVMTEQKKKRNKAAVDHVLEQLLKDIGHQDQIDQVITTLNRGRTTGSPGHRNIPDALAKLKEWSKGQLQEDPLVLLSCALEWTRISPLDRTFFTGRKVSFYELWSLAYNTAWDKENPLHCFLGFKDTKVTKQTTYEALWKWKEEHKYEDQMQILKDALSGTGDADILRRMINEHGVDTFPTVPTHTLQRILRDVDSLGKTEQFLHELCPHKQHSNTDASAVLEKWSNGPFTENPVILLSTALEKAGCEPLDRSFFTVPENLQHPISKQEVKDCVLKLTGRHSTRLANVLSITDKEKLLLTTSENNEMLFDTESMIHALITSMKCTNYAKRCRLDDALMKIGRHDMRNCFGTTEFLRPIGNPPHKKHPNSDQFDHESAFADDMMHMMENLPKDSSATFCKILTLPVRDDGKDETRFDEEHQEGINHTWTENQRHVTLRVCIALFDKMLEDFISKGKIFSSNELVMQLSKGEKE